MLYVLFVKQKTAYGLRISDWGSDLCSSDLVDVPVSSMNTRRSGSSSGWSSSQARRRRRTSGRCCSLACAVFFEGHAVTIEQPPHGALRHLHPVLPLQVPDDLRKRDVALSFDQPQGLRSVSLEVVRAVISALRAGPKVARPLPLIDPLDRKSTR